jgi:hypothetical protein
MEPQLANSAHSVIPSPVLKYWQNASNALPWQPEHRAMGKMRRKRRSCPCWESVSLEELAEQQQVLPVQNLDEFSELWPVEDDPDELLRYIAAERAEQRRLKQKPAE